MVTQLDLFGAEPVDTPTPSTAPVVLTKSGRRRRFKRTPDFRPDNSRAGRLQLTKRDLDLIATTAKMRFLSMHQACRLFACGCERRYQGNKKSRPAPVVAHEAHCSCTCGVGSGREEHAASCVALHRDDQHLARRMRELFQTYGYLQRPLGQLQLRVRDGIVHPGSVSMVYAVTQAGLAQLPEDVRTSINRGKHSFADKHDGGRMHMDHTLRIGDVHVAITVGLRKRNTLRRMSEAEMIARMPKKRQEAQFPFAIRVKHKGKKLTAICDLPIGIADTTTGKERLILTEIDLGSMPIVRKKRAVSDGEKGKALAQTSLMRKFVAYAHGYTDKMMQTELGFGNVVVLFLTTTEKRVAACVAEFKEHFASAPNLGRVFLFGTHAQVDDLWNATFIDGRGRAVKLFNESKDAPV